MQNQSNFKGPTNRIILKEGIFSGQNPEEEKNDQSKGEPPINCLKEIDFKHLQYVLALLQNSGPNESEIDYNRVVK